jgi:hypothetical protein
MSGFKKNILLRIVMLDFSLMWEFRYISRLNLYEYLVTRRSNYLYIYVNLKFSTFSRVFPTTNLFTNNLIYDCKHIIFTSSFGSNL